MCHSNSCFVPFQWTCVHDIHEYSEDLKKKQEATTSETSLSSTATAAEEHLQSRPGGVDGAWVSGEAVAGGSNRQQNDPDSEEEDYGSTDYTRSGGWSDTDSDSDSEEEIDTQRRMRSDIPMLTVRIPLRVSTLWNSTTDTAAASTSSGNVQDNVSHAQASSAQSVASGFSSSNSHDPESHSGLNPAEGSLFGSGSVGDSRVSRLLAEEILTAFPRSANSTALGRSQTDGDDTSRVSSGVPTQPNSHTVTFRAQIPLGRRPFHVELNGRRVLINANSRREVERFPSSQSNCYRSNRARLLNYIEEPNVGKGFIKEIAFSNDGRLLSSPFGFGLRLLSFDPFCRELCDCIPGQPVQLHEVTSNMSHSKEVVTTKWSPVHCLVVSGCLNGKVAFHQPLL